MKTTSRRRVLISSLAMLLVALVALGSATFAWFTSSTTATATGLAITTTKSSELKVSKLDMVWADTVNYNDEASSYVPASSTTGSAWFTGVAAAKNAYTSTGTYTTASSLTGVVYKEMLNIKNVGGKTANGVTITINGSFASNFGRLAVVPCGTAQSTAGTFPSITEANFSANIYGAAASDSWTPVKSTSALNSAAYTTKAYSGATISVGNMTANQVKSYMILVWFEGQDPDCYDLTTGALTIGSGTNISFTVSTT